MTVPFRYFRHSMYQYHSPIYLRHSALTSAEIVVPHWSSCMHSYPMKHLTLTSKASMQSESSDHHQIPRMQGGATHALPRLVDFTTRRGMAGNTESIFSLPCRPVSLFPCFSACFRRVGRRCHGAIVQGNRATGVSSITIITPHYNERQDSHIFGSLQRVFVTAGLFEGKINLSDNNFRSSITDIHACEIRYRGVRLYLLLPFRFPGRCRHIYPFPLLSLCSAGCFEQEGELCGVAQMPQSITTFANKNTTVAFQVAVFDAILMQHPVIRLDVDIVLLRAPIVFSHTVWTARESRNFARKMICGMFEQEKTKVI